MYSAPMAWSHTAIFLLSLFSFRFGIATPIDGHLAERAGIASPGIGVEFESGSIFFTKDVHNLSPQEQEAVKQAGFAAKGKSVALRAGNGGNGAKFSGDDWELTADSTGSVVGQLPAEYILDGKKIKLGTGRAAIAADEVYQNLVNICIGTRKKTWLTTSYRKNGTQSPASNLTSLATRRILGVLRWALTL